MKRIYNFCLHTGVAAALCLSFNSCIDETVPTSSATQEQVQESTAAAKASLDGLVAYLNHYDSGWSSRHWAFGYASMMIIRDIQTGDMPRVASGYDQYYYFAKNQYMSEDYVFMQYIWNYYYGLINAANLVIGSVDTSNASDTQKYYAGVGYAFRSLVYLDLARLYEYLPTAKTSPVTDEGNDVSGLTVPIVTESMSTDEAKNNPRATREEMAAFLLSDLDNAEELIKYSSSSDKTFPSLAVVYGLKARYYMWLEDYTNAKKYARLAIDNAGVQPMDEEASLNTKTGFNDISKWMWGSSLTSEDYFVLTGIINWTSQISNQTSFGYTGWGAANMPCNMIDRSMYERISDTDFRKYEFKAPKGSVIASKNRYIETPDVDQQDILPAYTSLKFRPNNGEPDDYKVGAASSYPLMRVEEMYFIEAEAAAHLSAAEGVALVNNFMQTYRDANYNCKATSTDDVVEEIVFQKRVELWGEGQTFFDIKRLNMSVTRNYDGTNFQEGCRFNTTGRPAWTNYVMIRTEGNNNAAVKGWNNPDPSEKETEE